jgi:hypothetical protein
MPSMLGAFPYFGRLPAFAITTLVVNLLLMGLNKFNAREHIPWHDRGLYSEDRAAVRGQSCVLRLESLGTVPGLGSGAKC